MQHVLLDGNALSIACASTTGHLLNGTLYGFLNMVNSHMKKFGAGNEKARFYVAWDAKNNWRLDVYPEYKESRRVKTDDEEKEKFWKKFQEQRRKIKEVLTSLPVIQLVADGFEADDIGGHFSAVSDNRKPVVLVTNDTDWLQLVRPHCPVYLSTKDTVVTEGNFFDITGVNYPSGYVQYKALMGDDGDDVPGAVGIGPKTAAKWANGEQVKGSKGEIIAEWVNNPEGYSRSLELVDIRGFKNQRTTYEFRLEEVKGNIQNRPFAEICNHYMFKSIIPKLPEWTKNQAPFWKGLEEISPEEHIIF